MSELAIRPALDDADRAWLAELWRHQWAGETMAARGRLVHVRDVAGLIAWRAGEPVGAATYLVEGPDAELTSLNALQPGQGVGAALLRAVEDAAGAAGCARLIIVTTNDNLDALGFYQRRGYRLRAVRPGAVEAARRTLKPAIPEVGDHGIPLRDELELEKRL